MALDISILLTLSRPHLNHYADANHLYHCVLSLLKGPCLKHEVQVRNFDPCHVLRILYFQLIVSRYDDYSTQVAQDGSVTTRLVWDRDEATKPLGYCLVSTT